MKGIAKDALPLRAVLFDLDGTLVDTAPDMVAVLTDMQNSRGKQPLDYEEIRAHVSKGAIGLLRLAFPESAAAQLADLQIEYLERYAQALCVQSSLFHGLAELLRGLDRIELPWGAVTNKPRHLTESLLEALGLLSRAASVVNGDTHPQRKPDPAPLLLAARQIGVNPTESVYVGDAARDIQAGRAAGMATIAARYGYIVPGDEISNWGTNFMVTDPVDLAQRLLKAVRL
jgi:phosphoglycolate phosphatase